MSCDRAPGQRAVGSARVRADRSRTRVGSLVPTRWPPRLHSRRCPEQHRRATSATASGRPEQGAGLRRQARSRGPGRMRPSRRPRPPSWCRSPPAPLVLRRSATSPPDCRWRLTRAPGWEQGPEPLPKPGRSEEPVSGPRMLVSAEPARLQVQAAAAEMERAAPRVPLEGLGHHVAVAG